MDLDLVFVIVVVVCSAAVDAGVCVLYATLMSNKVSQALPT